MKTVACIPIKGNSKRVKNKNIKLIYKKSLFKYLLEKISYCNFDDVYVDTDINLVKKFAIDKGFKIINRKPFLKTDKANGNDLLNYHSKIIDADIYFQLFVTSPLLSINTINKCIKIMKTYKKYDSIFTATKIYSWFWLKNKPVNYNPKTLPRSQDARPIIMETTGLYGIRKKTLKKLNCRIGKKPYMYFLNNPKEILDIDNKEDIDYFKYLLKK